MQKTEVKYQQERKYRRIKIKITDLSKINNTNCAVHNISREGMMVTAKIKNPPYRVTVELRINHQLVILQGNVMWSSGRKMSRMKKLGIFIIDAPPQFHDFINNLYLEADEQGLDNT